MSDIKYPNYWEVRKLGEVIDIQGGSQPPKSEFIYEPAPDYIQLLQIRDYGDKPVPTYVPKNRVTKFCNKNDVLIARYGASLGRIVTGQEGAYNVALAKTIYDKSIFIDSFIFYLLQTQIFQTPLKMISRSAQNGFAKHEIAHIKIPIPPSDEQTLIVAKIEELFSELDSGVASLKTAQEQLKVYRQALLKHAFEGKLTEQWRKDNTDQLETPEQLLARIQTERETRYQQQLDDWKQAVKDWEAKGKEGKRPSKPVSLKKLTPIEESDNFSSLPACWNTVKVGELAAVGTGVTPKKSNASFYDNGTIAWVTSGALNESFVRKASEYVTEEALAKTSLRLYSPNTLLIALYGEGKTRGKCSELLINATTNQAIAALETSYLPNDTRQFMKLFFFKNYQDMRTLSSGGVQPNLNLGIIENMPIPFCSLAEQKEIVNQLEEKLSIIEQNEKEIEDALAKAELLRQSILKKAFSGQLLNFNSE